MVETTQLYNLAACPADPAYSERLIAFSHAAYSATAKDYLLDSGWSLPHMSICFFRANSDECARALFAGAPPLPETAQTVKTEMLYDRPHQDENGEWMFSHGLLIRKTQALIEYQKEVRAYFTDANAQPSGVTGDAYWPHFTSAFTANGKHKADPAAILPWAYGDIPVRTVVGASDAVGQMLRIVAPL